MEIFNKEANPTLTVALPVYNSKDIVWLAIESLIRQKNIDFDWELIIIEELEPNGNNSEHYKQYSKRLQEAGCVRFVHKELKEWLPLPQKWVKLAQLSSPSSIAFILQASDCYSQPNRLKETHKYIVDKNFDWFDYRKGIFYEISTKRHIMYDDRYNSYLTGLNMATRTNYVRKLGENSRKKGIDGWMFKNIKPHRIKRLYNNNILNGCDTDGMNNISKKRKLYFANPEQAPFKKKPFKTTNESIEDRMPKDIVERLYNLYVKMHK